MADLWQIVQGSSLREDAAFVGGGSHAIEKILQRVEGLTAAFSDNPMLRGNADSFQTMQPKPQPAQTPATPTEKGDP